MRLRHKKTRQLVFLLGALLCAICLVLLMTRDVSEPRYNGKPIHVWLEQINEIDLRVAPARGVRLETSNAAVDAILRIGPDAMPWLRQELRAQESSFKKKLRHAVYRLPSRMQ